jgi:hypothetical protein
MILHTDFRAELYQSQKIISYLSSVKAADKSLEKEGG